ncbi:anti-phage ZorAB system protein ZorA [Nitrospinae bacterium]|nr:anti-phage ZorAB system protein ZorA [Nitrospinota bacterium]
MVTNVLESLFPFLFLFSDFSFEKGFPSVWILLILVTVIFQSFKFYKKKYLYCFNILENTCHILAGLKENKSSPEEIKSSLSEVPIINHYWSEFWETVVINKDQSGNDQFFNTVDAEYFFNEENLISDHIDIRFYNALPGILTALGILGTFLGLMFGLSNLDFASANSNELKEGIASLLSGATIAFSTSVWGMFSSICFNVLEKKCIKKLSLKVNDVKKLIDDLFDKKPAEKWLSEIHKEACQQTKTLKEFNDDLTLSIGEALESAFEKRLSPSLEKLGEAIENLNNAGVKGISESMQKAAGGEFERVAEIMRSVGETMKTTADYGQRIQADLESSLNDNINNFSNKIEEVFKDITKTTDDQTELIKNQINDLNTTTVDTTNRVANLVEGLSEKFSENMRIATQSIFEERQSVEKLLTEVNQSIGSMKELMLEAGLVADTFKESSQPVRDAVSYLTDQVKEMSRLQNNFMESSQKSTDSWNSSIINMEAILRQMNTGLDDTKILWSGYKDNFDNLRTDLNEVFKQMKEGLIEYRQTTGDGLTTYLQHFDTSMSNATGSLLAAIEELNDVVQELENRSN